MSTRSDKRYSGRSSALAALLTGAVIIVALSVLFAPAIGVGWCDDAGDAGVSACYLIYRSVTGIETNLGLWLVPVVLTAAATTVVALGRRRRAL
jgi:hypothetical protein